MANKKRKLSGLSGLELRQAYNSLLNLKKSFVYEEVDVESDDVQADKPADKEADKMEQELDKMLALMQSRLEEPKSFSFSSIDWSVLQDELNINSSGNLMLKHDHEELTKKSTQLGQDKYMSSEDMYRHLNMLENLVPKTSEASARLWIDTFFFRTSAMVPPGKSMILNLEYGLPSTTVFPTSSTKISGYIDYTAILANNADAGVIFTSVQILNVKQLLPTGLFVTEAKLLGHPLDDHLPQALAEMYACAKIMQKDIFRGALTNGHDWIFLILYLKQDGKGALYKRSITIRVDVLHPPTRRAEVVKPVPDTITGILSCWIENSFRDIAEDDWFEVVSKS